MVRLCDPLLNLGPPPVCERNEDKQFKWCVGGFMAATTQRKVNCPLSGRGHGYVTHFLNLRPSSCLWSG